MNHNPATSAPPTPDAIRALIVIPTYNNRATLREVVERALQTGLRVLVVNDGSDDGGPATLAGLPIKRIDIYPNEGKGVAIATAAHWASGQGFTHLITIDADGQHDPAEAPRFVEKIQENPWAIIVGERRMAESAAPGSSRFGRHFSNFWLKVATGVSLPDSQSGYRAYPVAALRALPCSGRHYEYEVEILVRAAWAGLPLESVPISVHYEPPERRVSHFRPFLDNMRISKIYSRSVIRNFIPWPHRRLPQAPPPAEERLSIKNPLRALKLLVRESASPREIALASMLGIFLGTLPLIACHSIVIIFCATRLRLNRLMAFSASNLCVAPLVPALAIEMGYYLRYGRFLTEFSLRTLGFEIHQRFFEYFLGSLVVGPALAVVVGAITYLIARGYQSAATRRRARLAAPEADPS